MPSRRRSEPRGRWVRLLLIFCILPGSASAATAVVERIASVGHPALGELSGLARGTDLAGASADSDQPATGRAAEARTDEPYFWAHNDSGDEARVFALRSDGSVIVPDLFTLIRPGAIADEWPGHRIDNAWQYDWEDLVVMDRVLYLADVGNNDNARRDLGVYVVPEPNPRAVLKTRALKFLPVRYPEQNRFPGSRWHYDCEAVFGFNGRLYFLTKHRKPGEPMGWEMGTRLYRLDTAHTDRDNVLRLVDEHDELTLPTAADVSADGERLAVLTYTHLWLFERPRRGDRWLSTRGVKLVLDRGQVKQNEAIAWESGDSLLMANENRDLFRVRLNGL